MAESTSYLVYLKVTIPNTNPPDGTGFFISSTKLVTAGHVLLPVASGTMSTAAARAFLNSMSVSVWVGGYRAAPADFVIPGNHLDVPAAWANSHATQSDYGVMKLNGGSHAGSTVALAVKSIADGANVAGYMSGYYSPANPAVVHSGPVYKSNGMTTLEYQNTPFPCQCGESGSPIMDALGNPAWGIHTDTGIPGPGWHNGVQVTSAFKSFVENF